MTVEQNNKVRKIHW